jgi:di/tricarboxylate transporter
MGARRGDDVTPEVTQLFGITAVMIALFVSDRVRLDVVALLALVAVSFTGVLTSEELTAGFSNAVVLVIAALFVVGEALTRTGVAAGVGRAAAKLAGASPTRLILILMLFTAVLSAFMSSTGAVAIMIPVCVGVARRGGLDAGRLLLPVSFAAQIGGALTLVGTAPNMVASAALEAAGLEPLKFHTFTPFGAAMLLGGMLFMVLVVDRRLRQRPVADEAGRPTLSLDTMLAGFMGDSVIAHLEVQPEGFCDGISIQAMNLRGRFDASIVEITRPAPLAGPKGPAYESVPLSPDRKIQSGDVLHVRVQPEHLDEVSVALDLRAVEEPPGSEHGLGPGTGLVEVILPPRSRLVGHTLAERQFRRKFGVNVLSIARLGRPLTENLSHTRLAFGDTLLVSGPWEQIALLRSENRDFLVVGEPAGLDDQLVQRDRAPLAVLVTLVMVAAMVFGWVSTVEAAIIAAVALIATRTVPVEAAYRSIQWSTLVLIAALLPLATALEKSGAMQVVVDGVMSVFGGSSPLLLLAVFAVLTSVMSQVVSNTATAVLVAPIALAAASQMEVSPVPFVLAVALAASTAFCTPIASPVNLLVVTPGGFRTRDFLTNGTGLALVSLVIIVVLVPLLTPF